MTVIRAGSTSHALDSTDCNHFKLDKLDINTTTMLFDYYNLLFNELQTGTPVWLTKWWIFYSS